jgi:5-carboxymethyl-2-hydroxymuconate isomerase
MPHLTLLYTPNLEHRVDLDVLCRKLADTMVAVRDEAGVAVFPKGGVRVLAFPAAHWAVADGAQEYGFAYLNLRMGRGRSQATRQQAGEMLSAVAKAHFAAALQALPVGVTLQIDEGPEVFDARHSTLHPLFAKGG